MKPIKTEKDTPMDDKRPESEFESPQTEESRRLAKTKTSENVERQDENPDDEGKSRGGNQSINQS